METSLPASPGSLVDALAANFLGRSPLWYKRTVVAFLLLNPLLLITAGGFVAGWTLVVEFIFTLAMALKCYPLQPGGLLAIEAIFLHMATPEAVFHELENAFPVILLLIFMVAGIYFLKDLLLFIFTRLLIRIRSKIWLALLFCAVGAFLSAFLDALTVTAVVIAVAQGFYLVYHRVASGAEFQSHYDAADDGHVTETHREDLERFRAFLRSLTMHAVVGTALGGVTTQVGEPQNLLIAEHAGWEFIEFFLRVAPVSMPVLVVGLVTCVLLERSRSFGFGARLPERVHLILLGYDAMESDRRGARDRARLIVQAVMVLWLIVALALHLAEVGIIGLSVIVCATAFGGVTQEKQIGHAFREALPFTALLVVFFGIVAVIDHQQLFRPILDRVLMLDGDMQTTAIYLANGLLSAISDNVFVATIYINGVQEAFLSGNLTRSQFDVLAVAINTGTNIPSVATPNGQAAFLFLLTSPLAPLIRLSYMRMVVMALPYTVTMTITGLLAVMFLL